MPFTLEFSWLGDAGISRPALLRALRERWPAAAEHLLAYRQSMLGGTGRIELAFSRSLPVDTAAEMVAFIRLNVAGLVDLEDATAAPDETSALDEAERILRGS